jgi:hypothetical protein
MVFVMPKFLGSSHWTGLLGTRLVMNDEDRTGGSTWCGVERFLLLCPHSVGQLLGTGLAMIGVGVGAERNGEQGTGK